MDLLQKLEVAYTKDKDSILESFICQSYGKEYHDAQIIYESLIEAELIDEANFFKETIEERLGKDACSKDNDFGNRFIAFQQEFNIDIEVAEIMWKDKTINNTVQEVKKTEDAFWIEMAKTKKLIQPLKLSPSQWFFIITKKRLSLKSIVFLSQ